MTAVCLTCLAELFCGVSPGRLQETCCTRTRFAGLRASNVAHQSTPFQTSQDRETDVLEPLPVSTGLEETARCVARHAASGQASEGIARPIPGFVTAAQDRRESNGSDVLYGALAGAAACWALGVRAKRQANGIAIASPMT